jgi:hypothetical protein
MAKGKDGKKYTPAQLMALKASVRTDLSSKAKVGPKSPTAKKVDQSKLADPYKTRVNRNALSGFQTPGAASIGMSQPTKASNIANAALTASTGGAATGFKVVSKTVVSQATKNLQRQLSKEMKDQSFKGLSKAQRQVKGERLSELTPEEFAEYKGGPKELSKKVSESMKKTTTTKKNIQRRK